MYGNGSKSIKFLANQNSAVCVQIKRTVTAKSVKRINRSTEIVIKTFAVYSTTKFRLSFFCFSLPNIKIGRKMFVSVIILKKYTYIYIYTSSHARTII